MTGKIETGSSLTGDPSIELSSIAESVAQGDRDVCEQIADGAPEEEDRSRVEVMRTSLKHGLSDYFSDDDRADVDPVVRLAFRARVFLRELDRRTD